ncbi:MAG TPA: hypothetical protein VGJ54_17665 [Streptosporangiaceae bacterium]
MPHPAARGALRKRRQAGRARDWVTLPPVAGVATGDGGTPDGMLSALGYAMRWVDGSDDGTARGW